MVDPKDQKDAKELNKQAPPDPQARPENELSDEDLERVAGGGTSTEVGATVALGVPAVLVAAAVAL